VAMTETVVTIVLNEKEHKLFFNANSMCAFEEATGKTFLATVASLYEAYRPLLTSQSQGEEVSPVAASFDIVKKVPMVELTALIWSALHTYDEKDEPHWPYTLAQVRRMMTLASIPKMFLSFLKGQSSNLPNQAELGESQALSGAETATAPNTAPNTDANGGERSIELPEGAFV